MTKINLQTRFANALELRGQTKVTTRSSKYIVYTRTVGEKPTFYYLGKSGSIRAGVKFATSYPVGESFRAELLNG